MGAAVHRVWGAAPSQGGEVDDDEAGGGGRDRKAGRAALEDRQKG